MNEHNEHRRKLRRENIRRNDLAYERRVRKLTLREAAEILEIPLQTLASYERGRYTPPLVVALKLQILYRGQIAAFYQPLHWQLTDAVRAAEMRILARRKGGQ